LLPPKSVAHIHLDRIPVEPEVTLAFIGGLAGGHCLTNICGAAVPWPALLFVARPSRDQGKMAATSRP
jgi:hypothetical protein